MDASSLLLLLPLPNPPNYAALKAAYHEPLVQLLQSLVKSHSTGRRPELDIVLPCSHLRLGDKIARGALFARTQKAVANLYKLIGIICAQNGFEVDGVEAIDSCVILVRYSSPEVEDDRQRGELGPVISLRTLASCRRWTTIYSIENEAGEQVLDTFAKFHQRHINIKKLKAGSIHLSQDKQEQDTTSSSSTSKWHLSVANGGTFDHLHIGHKLLLTMTAFALDNDDQKHDSQSTTTKTMTIGITAADLLKNKKYAEFLETWHERQAAVHKFMKRIMCFDSASEKISEINNPGPNGHAINVEMSGQLLIRYVEIWDPFGPTITDEDISALILSGETRKGGEAVNEKRANLGWSALDVFEVDVLDNVEKSEEQDMNDESYQAKLSSTEIRKRRSERQDLSK